MTFLVFFFFHGNFYEFNIRNKSWSVKGRFNSAVGFWKTTLNAPEFVLDVIRRGLRLPFAEYPPPCLLPKNKSAVAHGCIVEHSVPIFCVNPLTVAEGKKAVLSNWFNNYLVKCRFKYKDLPSLSQVLEEGHWFFAWGLKSGYHHMDICSEHQAFLGFPWSIDGVLKYFTFTVLPFGLSRSCYSFTKLLRLLLKHWCYVGHTSLVYLDDGFGSQPDMRSAVAAAIIQQKN